MIDPTAADAPEQLATRAGELLVLLLDHGIDPLHDATDLLLVSLLPLAIKRVLMPNPLGDVELLVDVLARMDLTGVEFMIKRGWMPRTGIDR